MYNIPDEAFPRHLKWLLRHYLTLMHGRGGIPSRADLNPADMKPILSWLVLTDHPGPQQAIPRVVGTDVDMFLQANFTGVNLFNMWTPEMAVMMDDFYNHILVRPCGGYMRRLVRTHRGQDRRYESLLLPLRDRNGDANMMVGVLQSSHQAAADDDYDSRPEISDAQLEAYDFVDIGFGVPRPLAMPRCRTNVYRPFETVRRVRNY